MNSSSQVPLKQLRQLWAADVLSLRDLGITTAGDLVQTVHEKGLKKLSDSSAIPVDHLQQYFNTASTASARVETRGRATVSFALVCVVIGALTVGMFLFLQPAPADAAYAELYAGLFPELDDELSPREISTDNLNTFKSTVDGKLADYKDEPAESLVNLRLLMLAVNDTLALEQLEAAGNDPSTANYKEHYRRYKALFDEAREAQGLIDELDPRISLARLGAAQAWSSRAKIQSKIDLENLDEVTSDRISSDIEIAKANALRETTLIRNTTDLSGELLGLIQPAVFDERINETYQPPSVGEQIDDLKQELVQGINETLQGQEKSIVKKVNVAHNETRTLIDKDNASLALQIHSVSERYVVDIGATPNATCGLRGIAAAETTIHTQCIPRTGMTETVSLDISIENSAGNSAPVIVVENGESPSSLSCAVEDVMAKFNYDDGVHGCHIEIRTERDNVYRLSTQQ